jgi:hypothetical protein
MIFSYIDGIFSYIDGGFKATFDFKMPLILKWFNEF